MKVLLIHASISSCGFDSFAKNDPTESSWINHGVCSISSYAKKKGFYPELLDLRLLKDWNDFRSKIKLLNPDVVGLSMMSVDYNPVVNCAMIIKECNPKTKIVVGGAHPTVMIEDIIDNHNFDFIIQGEGEISFSELLKNIKEGNQSDRVIKGIRPELDELPFIDRNLYSGHERPIISDFSEPFVTIIAGRGCKYNCNFCQPAERKIFGKKVRRRSAFNVISELKVLRDEHKFNSLMIHDDCITEDVEWVEEFCDLYVKEGFKEPFICQSRADLICRNEGLIKKMKETGLVMFIIGFESGNQRVLNFLKKGTKVEQNYRAAKICRRYGIKVWANYMLGIPTETKTEAKDTVRMIEEIAPDHCSLAFFTPHPGSDLYEYCEKNDLSLIKTHEEYRRNPFGAKIKGVNYKFLNKISGRDRSNIIFKLRANKTFVFMKNKIKKTEIGRECIKLTKSLLQR